MRAKVNAARASQVQRAADRRRRRRRPPSLRRVCVGSFRRRRHIYA